MAKAIKSITINWSWDGDSYAVRGFNLAITPSDANPKTNVTVSASVTGDGTIRTYTFKDVTLDTAITYTAWVQAIYDGADSDWVSAGNMTVTDDGSATVASKTQMDSGDSSTLTGATATGSYVNNSIFNNWTGTWPAGLSSWSSTPAPVKITGTINGGYGVQFKDTGVINTGAYLTGFFNANIQNSKYLTVEIDVRLDKGTSFDGTGVLLDWSGMGTYRGVLKLKDEIPANLVETGRWYSVTKVIRRPSDVLTGYTNMSGYLMANYTSSGLGTALTDKSITFDRLVVRQSTQQEIDVYEGKGVWDGTTSLTEGWKYAGSTQINGTSIYTRTITANEIATGTLTANEIQANAITADRIRIGDFNNYVDDPSFTLGSYSPSTPWSIVTTPVKNTGGKSLKLAATTTDWANIKLTNSPFPVKSGDQFYIEYWAYRESANQAIETNISVRGYDATWDYDSDNNVVAPNTATNNTWIKYSGITNVTKDGTAQIEMKLPTATDMTGSWYVSDIIARRAYKGEMIVDGSITAKELAVGSVSADKILVGDSTNLAIANEKTGILVDGVLNRIDSGYVKKGDATWTNLGLSNIVPVDFKTGDYLYFQGDIFSPTATTGRFGLRYYDSAKAYISAQYGPTQSISTSAVTKTSQLSLTIPATAVYYQLVFVDDGATKYDIGIKNSLARRMTGGELIVDGSISASKIIVGDGAAGDGNLASGKTFTGNSNGTALSSALPGDGVRDIGSTYFSFGVSSGTPGAGTERDYIQVDLGSVYRIEESRAYLYSVDDRSYWYKIKYSADNTNWYYAAGNANNDGWKKSIKKSVSGASKTNPTIDRFSMPISARYLRLYADGNSVNTSNHVYEWELFSYIQTQITGDQIATGSIAADRINAKGLVATNANNEITFKIDGSTGDVTMKGTITMTSGTIGGTDATTVESNANSARTDITNLKIGGTNLIPGTDLQNDWDNTAPYWATWNSNTDVPAYNDITLVNKNSFRFLKVASVQGLASGASFGLASGDISTARKFRTVAGKEYTLSFLVARHGNATADINYTYLICDGGSNQKIPTTDVTTFPVLSAFDATSNSFGLTVYEYKCTFTAASTSERTRLLIGAKTSADFTGTGNYGLFYVANIQLEEGNRATYWTPANEDVRKQIDEAVDKVTEEYTAFVGQTATDLELEMVDKIQQSETGITAKYEAAIAASDSTTDDKIAGVQSDITLLNGDITQINDYFDFNSTELVMGKTDNPMNITISNDMIEMIDNGVTVAYINGQKMYIDSLEVLTNIVVGNHKIEKTTTGLTLIKYVGS